MCWQVVNTEFETNNFDLQPTFSECLEYIEGDPCEDSRQSKKQKVPFLPVSFLMKPPCLDRIVPKLVYVWCLPSSSMVLADARFEAIC